MADEIVTLSEESMRLLQGLLDASRKKIENTVNRPAVDIITPQSTSVYMALATNGLPALSDDDKPGVGECGIYRLIPGTQTIGYIGRSEVVYNPYSSAVSPGSYIAIAKDRFGNWLATGPSVGAGTPTNPDTGHDENKVEPYLDLVVEVCPVFSTAPLPPEEGGTGIDNPTGGGLLIGDGTGGWTQGNLSDLLDSMGGVTGTFGG